MDKIDLIINKIDDLKESHSKRLDSIDENLKEHMRRTDVLEKLHQNNERRIVKLEEPKRWRLQTKMMIINLGKVCGAVLSIYGLIRMFNG